MAAPSDRPAPLRARHLVPTPDDARRLWTLSLPVVVVQLGMMLMGVVTTIMVGHVSSTELAAAALGNLCFIWLVLLGWGTLMSLDPVIAQAHGAGDREGVARGVQRGLVLAVGLSALTALLFLPIHAVLDLLDQPRDVVPLAVRYVEVSIPGILPFFVFLVLRQSLQAVGRMRAIVIAIVVANVVNAAFGWALVFGRLGCPALGAVGAGLAATVGRVVLALELAALAWRELRSWLRPWRREALDPHALAGLLRLGVPIGLQMQLEYGVFAFVALLMDRLGTVYMAAHQVALTVTSVTFMVPQGIGAAAAVLVGHSVGAGDGAGARRAAAAALGAGAGFMLLCGFALAALPWSLASIFSTEVPVVAVAAVLLPIAGVFQVFDGIQVVAIGILRGVGDTRAPVLLNVLGFWLVGLPASLWFGFGLHGGAAGLWWGLVVGLVVVALGLLARVAQRLGGSLARVSVERPSAPV